MITSKEALKQIMEKYIFYVPARSEGKEHLINCFNIVAKDLERLETLEGENQELKNKYEKLKTKYSNIRKYPAINQALMSYDEMNWEILKDEYGEEVFRND